ncbi:MAG: Hsp20/alpha crystallin family protein [Planctomycetota bacterium]
MMLKTKNHLPQPRDPFRSLFGHLFGETLADFYGQPAQDGAAPRTNIAETETGYELAFELPGVAEADIQVQLHDHVLTVSALRRDEREAEEGRRWHRVEHRYGETSRAITLPKDAADDGVDAVFKQGVLTVSVPKQAAAQPARIEVRAE